MSLHRCCVFLSLLGVRRQIAETVAGDRKAGRGGGGKAGRSHFASSAKGAAKNALNLSCTIGRVALGQRGGGEEFSRELCALSDSTLCRAQGKSFCAVVFLRLLYILRFLFLLCPSPPPLHH